MRNKYNVRYFNNISKTTFSSYVLGIDIGGTNTNLGIAGIKDKKLTMLFSFDFKSKELPSIIPAINEISSFAKNNYDISIDNTCMGVPGVVDSDDEYIDLMNLDWNINVKELIEKTNLDSVFIINDFQVIGYGINLIDIKTKKDFMIINKGNPKTNENSTKAVLGAGTGLGKSVLFYDKHFDAYVPVPSEGGHNDFPPQNDFELELVQFIKKLRNISCPISYEELLSGRGIENIYLYLKEHGGIKPSKYTKEIDKSKEKSELISKYKKIDETCSQTFRFYTKFYARCAKNFALDVLARGGLFIAGGIASKNREIFATDDFLSEFNKSHARSDVLNKIPIYLILDYDISLYGACFAAMYSMKNEF